MSETTSPRPGTTTYKVEVHPDGVLIYTYRVAGICGPANTTARPATLAEVDAWLASVEFTRTGEWEIGETFQGLMLSAAVERVERPVVAIESVEWTAPGHGGGVPLVTRRSRRRR